MTGLAGPALASASALAAAAGARSWFRARPSTAVRPAGARRMRGPWVRVPGWNAFDARVTQSGIGMRSDLLVLAAIGAGFMIAAGLVLVLRQPAAAVLGVVAAVVGVRAVLATARRRHLRRVGEAMPAVAQMLAGAVAAGLSLRQAIIRAARDTPDPLGTELRQAAGEMELGARVDDALSGVAARMPDPDLGLLITAILVQRRTGGDLARALRDMSGRLEERGRLARELRGATAQARATAWMVAALPVVGAALAEAAAPGLMSRTASTTVGAAVLAVAIVMQVGGIVLIRRLSAIEP